MNKAHADNHEASCNIWLVCLWHGSVLRPVAGLCFCLVSQDPSCWKVSQTQSQRAFSSLQFNALLFPGLVAFLTRISLVLKEYNFNCKISAEILSLYIVCFFNFKRNRTSLSDSYIEFLIYAFVVNGYVPKGSCGLSVKVILVIIAQYQVAALFTRYPRRSGLNIMGRLLFFYFLSY